MKINLGCGNDIRAGFVNCDMRQFPGVDRVFNITDLMWPFQSNSAELIVASALFEHVPSLLPVLNECHRVLQNGGELWISGPTPTSKYLWLDVTHVRAFTKHCFDHFDPRTPLGQQFHYWPPTFRVVDERVVDDGNMIEFILLADKP